MGSSQGRHQADAQQNQLAGRIDESTRAKPGLEVAARILDIIGRSPRNPKEIASRRSGRGEKATHTLWVKEAALSSSNAIPLRSAILASG
jgi:hypothetical protein